MIKLIETCCQFIFDGFVKSPIFHLYVIPAEAGIYNVFQDWIPASAGMTCLPAFYGLIIFYNCSKSCGNGKGNVFYALTKL